MWTASYKRSYKDREIIKYTCSSERMHNKLHILS